MAGQFIGVAGVARKVKSQFVGVGSVARKVKAGYTGVGGVARQFIKGADPILANNDWTTIGEVSAAGNAGKLWAVGDEKDITLTTGEVLTLVIMGFDHDDLAAGGKAGITFGLKNLMKDVRQMNATSTNVGGYTGTAMYTWLNETLFSQLPADLQAVIKSVNKKTSAGNKSTTIQTDSMRLFLFSEQEVFGTKYYSAAGEGAQYSYFTKDSASSQKMLANGTGSSNAWLLRSPVVSGTNAFCCVNNNGGYSSSSGGSRGVCFGFCV